MRYRVIIIIFLTCLALPSFSQEDLMKELNQDSTPVTTYTIQTFKGTRLVNGQTIETRGRRELEFIFAHRFGAISGGSYELFGLDQAYVRYGLEYGITNELGVGIGRNSVDKTSDGYIRYKLLRQSSGAVNMPVTITFFGNGAIRSSPRKNDAGYNIRFADRLSYTAQLLIARKFNTNFSLQLMPSFVHKNTVDRTIENNDTFLMGAGGRMKVSRRVAITSEYYYRFATSVANPYYNSIGVGVDLETGGHVFQLVLTNSRGLTERAFLTETEGKVSKGDIHFGFNVTRLFPSRHRSGRSN